MNIIILKNNIDNKYRYLQTEIKNIRQSEFFKGMQQLINHYNNSKQTDKAYQLNEALEAETQLSNKYIELNNLYYDRLTWLANYTNNSIVLTDTYNGDYYHTMAYKAIHEDYIDKRIQNLIVNRIDQTV
ncbi:hypothetical protein [Aquibacillus saliphilus]|uniref:hypothetical protein n=1 Tax=Aquibacillus saliphilus TaxID=1909422 RepID=UPI001CF0704E|nr:hypothetical protein [Aquibacillus saliphilus]